MGCADDEYLQLLEDHLPAAFARLRPTLCFFQAGVDPHASDRFGKLQISSAGLKRRNALVYRLAAEHRARLVVTMGGGYPKDLDESSTPFVQVVQAHMDCYRQAAAAHAKVRS